MSGKVVWPDSNVTLVSQIVKRNADLDCNSLAVTSETENVTWGEMLKRTNRYSRAALGSGIKKGTRVCVLSLNRLEWYDIYFGNGQLGAITVPLNFRLAPPEMEYIISQSDATTVICSGDYVDIINFIRPSLKNVTNYVTLDEHDNAKGFVVYRDWIAAQSDEVFTPPEPVLPEDVFWQMYTSGTTGRPKGTLISNTSVITNVSQIAGCMSDNSLMRHGNRTLIVAPLYHVAAALMSIIGIFHGGAIVVRAAFNPVTVLQLIDAGEVTHALLVPAMILAIISNPNCGKLNLDALKLVLYGASAIPAEVLKKALNTFSGCDFLQAFGQTEATAVMSMLTPEMHRMAVTTHPHLITSCGKPVKDMDVHVWNSKDEDVQPGEIGEVVGKGKNMMLGYYKMQEASAEALRGGYLRTGDLATVDEEGYIYIKDRSKDMVVSGGENVYPREVEEVLFEMEQVQDAAVIGVPDEKYGEAVKACIVLKEGAKLEVNEMIEFCRARIAGYKIPRSMDIMDALPKNPSGKILKTELRKPYWEGRDRNVN